MDYDSERTGRYVAAVVAAAGLAGDERPGVALALDRYRHVGARDAVLLPNLDAGFDWTRDLWWPDDPGGRLLRALHTADDTALTGC